jgi:membrane-associated phospholipid phosphatase
MKFFSDLFRIDKSPKKGLLAVEWVIMGYLAFTLLLMLFTYTKLCSPVPMLWGRVQILAMTAALWGVYRMIPCRFTMLCRILAQLGLLSWWYPDTYEFNRMFPNLDDYFATMEQQLFGCQPALLFSQTFTSAWWSELMHLGYSCYYVLIALVTLWYFIFRYEHFHRTAFIILTSFFIYYVIYIFLPVAGPQYYYLAVGVNDIAHGIFPNVHDYFATHQQAMTVPGWNGGFFYHIVESAHAAGERPTAAFPSSHVGVSTILLLLAWNSKNRRLFFSLLPFYILLCLSTVYIQAHYAVDVLGGWVSAVVLYFLLYFVYTRWIGEEK